MNLPTERDRSRMLTALAVIGGLIVCSAVYWYFFGPRSPQSALELPEVSEAVVPVESDTNREPEQVSEIGVDVVGAVQQPGLYYFEPGARVADAVRAAGGYAPNANREAINEAVRLKDEQQVRVPKVEDEVGDQTAPALANDAPTAPALIDLNTADVQVLDTLPGIGPETAGQIVAYREANGSFATVEQLLDVPGIGPATLTTLSQYVMVAP